MPYFSTKGRAICQGQLPESPMSTAISVISDIDSFIANTPELTSIPDDQQAALLKAYDAVCIIHATIICNDNTPLREQNIILHRAIEWKLNGGTLSGSRKDQSSAGYLIENYCRCTPGVIPMWSQRGEFVITLKGIQVIVKHTPSFFASTDQVKINSHFEFIAVSKDEPFISETGYRSHFDNIYPGKCVDEAAVIIFSSYLKEKKTHVSNKLSQDSPIPKWAKSYIIPDSHEFVEAILPRHQAFQVKKWADEATKKLTQYRNAEIIKHQREIIKVGSRCRIIETRFPKELGNIVIISKISETCVFAYDDKPIRYKINARGKKVVASDPRCVQSLYGYNQLQLLQ
jgi:hypothetical protein